MSTSWHYLKDGVQAGPATTEEITSMITSGAIKADVMVWREGLAAWAPANTQSEFSGVAAPAAPPAPPPPPPASAAAPAPATGAADVEQNKVFAVLSYLPPFLFLVPLLAARQSKFAMYHCNQGIVLTIVAFVVSIVNYILDMILWHIPYIGFAMITLLNLAIFAGILVLVVMGIINAANGVCKPLPLIGDRVTLIK
jgi:uncharacterized membrane protein